MKRPVMMTLVGVMAVGAAVYFTTSSIFGNDATDDTNATNDEAIQVAENAAVSGDLGQAQSDGAEADALVSSSTGDSAEALETADEVSASGSSGVPPRDLSPIALWEHPLGDIVLGDESAPVTMIEYISLTCPACASFHQTTYDHLKETYVDTGKVRLILREFPLDQIALAAAMVVRCAPEDRRASVIDLILKSQSDWARDDTAFASLVDHLGQAGFSRARVKECLDDSDAQAGILETREAGSADFDVSSTPTFFINGEKVSGSLTVESLDETLGALLP